MFRPTAFICQCEDTVLRLNARNRESRAASAILRNYQRSLIAIHRSHCHGRAWPGDDSRGNARVIINELWYKGSEYG
jgi:hypothetical protein